MVHEKDLQEVLMLVMWRYQLEVMHFALEASYEWLVPSALLCREGTNKHVLHRLMGRVICSIVINIFCCMYHGSIMHKSHVK